MQGVDPIAAIGMSNLANIEKLSQWVMKSRLDPNDPNNADLMFLMQVSKLLYNFTDFLYKLFVSLLIFCSLANGQRILLRNHF